MRPDRSLRTIVGFLCILPPLVLGAVRFPDHSSQAAPQNSCKTNAECLAAGLPIMKPRERPAFPQLKKRAPATVVYYSTGQSSTYTVPVAGQYKFIVLGASGGRSSRNGATSGFPTGQSTTMFIALRFPENATLTLQVGQKGSDFTGQQGGGGGGGASYIFDNFVLATAGGGGGAGPSSSGSNAGLSVQGGDASGPGGAAGQPNQYGATGGSGGAGWRYDGQDGSEGSTGGKSFVNGGQGGQGGLNGGSGGYGGGGGGDGGGGGGAGYNGGAGGAPTYGGDGGTSYRTTDSTYQAQVFSVFTTQVTDNYAFDGFINVIPPGGVCHFTCPSSNRGNAFVSYDRTNGQIACRYGGTTCAYGANGGNYFPTYYSGSASNNCEGKNTGNLACNDGAAAGAMQWSPNLG